MRTFTFYKNNELYRKYHFTEEELAKRFIRFILLVASTDFGKKWMVRYQGIRSKRLIMHFINHSDGLGSTYELSEERELINYLTIVKNEVFKKIYVGKVRGKQL